MPSNAGTHCPRHRGTPTYWNDSHWVCEECDRELYNSDLEPPIPDTVLVPVDATWPTHCQQAMWFRGGEHPKFYCDCGHERPPLPTEVRDASVCPFCANKP